MHFPKTASSQAKCNSNTNLPDNTRSFQGHMSNPTASHFTLLVICKRHFPVLSTQLFFTKSINQSVCLSVCWGGRGALLKRHIF
ncbi:hypothetical protein OIU78_015369 [Salix suchowensis]|nr:hypothetical protein OIU78_015369 [Salix suchowensis]